MATQGGKKKRYYQSKAKLLADAEPFKITRVNVAQECYLDKESLQAYSLGTYTGTFKNDKDIPWTVTILPAEIRNMQTHSDVMEVYTKIGMDRYFKLPAQGMDVKRCYQLVTSLQDDGQATIDGPDGIEVQVVISEETIRDALLVPKGNTSLLTKNTAVELNHTYMKTGQGDYTYRDLIRPQVEIPLRLFTQHFQHGKAVRYTHPHRKMAIVFTQASTSQKHWSLNFAGLFLSELKAFATKSSQLKQRHINCTWMLTRIAYFAVGMIEDLPPALPHTYWIAESQLPAEIRVKGKKKAAPSSRATRHKEKKREQEVPHESSTDTIPKHLSSSSDDSSEKTETDREQSEPEQEEQSHPEAKEIPAVSQQRQRWADILDEEERRKKELRTKKGRDPSAQTSADPQAALEKEKEERQKEIEERISLAEKQRERILERLKRKAEEERQQEQSGKRPRVEHVDIPPSSSPPHSRPLSPPSSPPFVIPSSPPHSVPLPTVSSPPLTTPSSPPLIINLTPVTPPSSPPHS